MYVPTFKMPCMHNSKTLGPDGIPVEFYKHFWPQIKDSLMDLIYNLEKGEDWDAYFLQGLITLIPEETCL